MAIGFSQLFYKNHSEKLLVIETNWAPQQIITYKCGQCQCCVPIFIQSIQVDAIQKQPIEFTLIACVRSNL